MIDFILYKFQQSIIAMWNDYGDLTFADITELSVTGEVEVKVTYDSNEGIGRTRWETRDFRIYPTYFMQGAKDNSEFAEEANYDLHDFMKEISEDELFQKFTITDLDKLDYPKELFLQTALQELFKQGCYENMQGIRL